LSFNGCKTSQNSRAHRRILKEIYVEKFKLIYIREYLIKNYNNSIAINLDSSGFSEPILTMDDYKLMDSLTTIDSTKLTNDAINRIGKVAEGAGGKHISIYLLEKIESKWLDSLDRRRYKYAKVDRHTKDILN
jgi:hypothetical protein